MENDQSRTGMKRYSRTSSILIFLVVVLVLSFFMKRTDVVSFIFEKEKDYFTIETASGFSTVITWDEIVSYEIRETLDLGTMRDGTDTEKEQSGTWENDEFGVYTLCTDASIECYLILYLEDGVVVTNFESDKSTASLGQAIGERL